MAKERLDKILSNNGFGSRSQVKHLIRSGRVCADGQVVYDATLHLDTEETSLTVDNEIVVIKKDLYIMLNKKAGTVCSTKDGERETVYACLEGEALRRYEKGQISSIGRLDLDTEGLLILTSDGLLNHRLTSPKNMIPKKYLVRLERQVSNQEKEDYRQKLSQGIFVRAEGKEAEFTSLPAQLEWNETEGECTITVYEGKYHEIKRLFAELGNKVTYLKRLSMNKLKLDENLEPGTYRELTQEELELLDAKQEEE